MTPPPIYHRFPPWLQSVAASLRGWQLRSRRYGPETERLVEEALEREAWNPEQWERYRAERLAFLLRRAATRVPYYRDYWRTAGGGERAWAALENWPILRKETVRERPEAFIAEDRNLHSMFEEQTSGTSGTPLTVWWSRQTTRSWSALFEARVRRWNGVSRLDRWAILGGQLVVPAGRPRPPFWVWNAPMNQLYLSSYHLAPQNAASYAQALARYRVVYLFGYPSAMTTLARLAMDRGLRLPRLRVAISNAELLSDHQRAVISEAFGCPVRDSYGMSELVWGGSECERGGFHSWPEAGTGEILRDRTDEPLPTGEVGRFVFTGLLNADMPLVRYEIGDRGAMAGPGKICECGRTLPLIRTIEGRSDDAVVTVDGRSIGRLDPVFKADLPIREAQIVQEALDRIRVRVVPGPEWTERHAATVQSRLRERVGSGMHVTVEPVAGIPRGPGNKFRAVICRVPASVRNSVGAGASLEAVSGR
jgi:phenylacetate-coenzyme A ligase PaaK-like adenylate-forming protein